MELQISGARRPLLLVGAGSFVAEVAEIATGAGWDVVGCIEGLDRERADRFATPPIVWVDEQAGFEPSARIAPAIGSVERRGLVERLVADGRELATVIHPGATVSDSAVIEPGCVIFPGAIIGANVHIGPATIVHRGSLIGHDTVIGAHGMLGPGANLAGHLVVGDQVHLAIGSVVRDHLEIGARATVGAGAVVVADVAAGTTVFGVPAQPH